MKTADEIQTELLVVFDNIQNEHFSYSAFEAYQFWDLYVPYQGTYFKKDDSQI